jgi:hypothetical protein
MIKNKQHTKLKRLQQMMVRWAEQNKQRFVGNIWKKEFKYVLELENKTSLSRIHMIECNKLFKEYRC